VCEPGFGRAAYGTCERCPVGTFNFGDTYDACMECPFPKTTAFSGATSDADCSECCCWREAALVPGAHCSGHVSVHAAAAAAAAAAADDKSHTALVSPACCACAVCPGGSGTGPACDQCPPHMELMENGICE
jgi:hypothetical protein